VAVLFLSERSAPRRALCVLALHAIQAVARAAYRHFGRAQLASEAVALELIAVYLACDAADLCFDGLQLGLGLLPIRLWRGGGRG
jgi:hypothetical protein